MDKVADRPEQLVHESETQRQYVRVDMPSRARINNKEYPVHNISAGGVSIRDKENIYRTGQVFDFFLIVPFQSFALDIPLKVEVEHYNKENGLLGCRFLDLTKEKISILTHIVRGYISGDLVTAGELLNVVSRNNFARPRVAGSTEAFHFSLRQIVPLAFICLLGLIAVYFLTANLYRGVFTVQSARGVVVGEVQEVKAPHGGIFQNDLKASAKLVEAGQKIGRIVPSLMAADNAQGEIELKSPCTCHIVTRDAKPQQYMEAGENILTLEPVDAPLWVSVIVDPAQAQKISLKDWAEIKIAGSDVVLTGKVAKYESSIDDLKGAASEAGGPAQPVTTITIIPDQKLPVDMRGRPVTVTFRL